MLARSRTGAFRALPALLLSGCIGSSILDTNTGTVFLPALETVQYDSLAGGKIAFQRFGVAAGNFQGVYIVDAGSLPQRSQSLLASQALDRGQLTPDGTKILFGGATGENASVFDIFIVKLSDSTKTRITSAPVNEEGPSWLPDASQIFYRIRGNGLTTLYRQSPVANAADKVSTVLTDSGGLAWNVDGPLSANAASRVVFVTYSQGFRIWAANIDGTNRLALKTDPATSGPVFQTPTWSPDGTKIAFLQLGYDATNRVISTSVKTMLPDGTGEVTVATVGTPGTLFAPNSLSDFSLCYTGPTGSRIAFTALGSDGTSHVFVVRPTGGPVTQITTNSGVWDRGVSCKH